MRTLLAICFLLPGLVLIGAPAPQKPAAKKSAWKTPVKPSAKAPARTAGKPVSKKARNARYRAPRVSRPIGPMQPSADRISEIQSALAAKGYFNGQPNGVWNADSIEALKRFQRDQNLRDDGKISALSLIALGLGPERSTVADNKPQN
ncbi:MAG: peptidoglycan-binding protein [Bryobacteraceae bacterium]|nr:peptidoglycan-binding protein [Bryobacteraceae bacterium]